MTKKKGFLQKTSLVFAWVSFALAIISSVALYLRIDTLGNNNPIAASLMASTFFFLCVGAVMLIIGKTDLPSFKVK